MQPTACISVARAEASIWQAPDKCGHSIALVLMQIFWNTEQSDVC